MSPATRQLALSAAAALALGPGCVRSPALQRDQEYHRGEPASYYSSRSGKSPTQRIESMGQPKKRLVVLGFWNDTPVKQADLGGFAAEELRRGLHQTQRILLPPEAKTDLGTEDFVQGDKVRVAQLMREGRRMGVSVLVIGRVTKIAFRERGDDVGLLRQKQSLAGVDAEIKVFDVTAGREIAAVAKSGQASNNALAAFDRDKEESAEFRAELTKLAVRDAVAQLVSEVVRSVEKMTWEGRVAKVSGNRVYVNAGRASGLIAGDILKVLTPGDDIYDPMTGAYLGRSHGQLKGTLEVADFIGTDGAVTEVHTGANFREGDSVQLY